MKKTLFVFVLSIFITGTTFAQVKPGLTAGLNFFSFSESGTDAEKYNFSAGFQGGLFVDVGITGNFSIIPELLFSQRGAMQWFEDEDNSDNYLKYYITLNYLQVPVNLAYKVNMGRSSKLFLFAGPYVGYALSGNREMELKLDGEKESFKEKMEIGSEVDQCKALDYGINIGTGIQFGKSFIKLQYNMGLNNLYNHDLATLKNVNVGLTYGLYF